MFDASYCYCFEVRNGWGKGCLCPSYRMIERADPYQEGIVAVRSVTSLSKAEREGLEEERVYC